MAVYARGYRRYEGGFGFNLPALTIAWDAIKQLHRGWGIRILWLIQLIIMVMFGAMSYVGLNFSRVVDKLGGGQASANETAEQMRAIVLRGLDETLVAIYTVPQLALCALVAIIVGSGLISNDLRTRALSLYLARPMRRIDYCAGKALVLPVMLFFTAFLPGFFVFMLYGLWHPVDDVGTFLADNSRYLGMITKHYLVIATSYTGLMLILSSTTSRAGVVKGLGALVLFAGSVIAPMLSRIPGWIGDAMVYLSLPGNALPEFIQLQIDRGRIHITDRFDLPQIEVSLLLGFVLLAAGMFIVARRARSAEVVG